MASDPNAGLTGAAFELASAGYGPMPEADQIEDEEAIGGDRASLCEAAGHAPIRARRPWFGGISTARASRWRRTKHDARACRARLRRGNERR